MRTANKNKQELYYALFLEKRAVLDADGRKTGQHEVVYDEPVQAFMNISASRGTSDVEQFGIATDYSKTLVTDDLECPIVEGSILWIGVAPDMQNTIPHNYVVTKVAKSINCISYAIKEVDVSASSDVVYASKGD